MNPRDFLDPQTLHGTFTRRRWVSFGPSMAPVRDGGTKLCRAEGLSPRYAVNYYAMGYTLQAGFGTVRNDL